MMTMLQYPPHLVTGRLTRWAGSKSGDPKIRVSEMWYGATRTQGGAYQLISYYQKTDDSISATSIDQPISYNAVLIRLCHFEQGNTDTAAGKRVIENGMLYRAKINPRMFSFDIAPALRAGTHYSLHHPDLPPVQPPSFLRRTFTAALKAMLSDGPPRIWRHTLRTRCLYRYEKNGGRERKYFQASQNMKTGLWTIARARDRGSNYNPFHMRDLRWEMTQYDMLKRMEEYEERILSQFYQQPSGGWMLERDLREHDYFGHFIPSLAAKILSSPTPGFDNPSRLVTKYQTPASRAGSQSQKP